MIDAWIWWLIIAGLVIILILVVGLIITQRRTANPEHVGLYFDRHFNNMVNEWDLIRRPKAKSWKRDMNMRLDVIEKDINSLNDRRSDINLRVEKLKREMGKI